MEVTREQRAQGQVTERLLHPSVLNSVYACLAVTILFAWLSHKYRGGWGLILMRPMYLIFGSLLLALAASAVTLGLLR